MKTTQMSQKASKLRLDIPEEDSNDDGQYANGNGAFYENRY